MKSGQPAVFAGAGISGSPPASLPLGYALRDSVLTLMHRCAKDYAPDLIGDEQYEELRRPERKLEQVLGRLWRVIGDEALNCLHCLQIPLPNEAHMLCALHVARGGVVATLNFDRGIEMAYDLIAGLSHLPSSLQRIYGPSLTRWRTSAGTVSALRTVASHEEFARWSNDGCPPALLKLHGSLAATGLHLVDVVVEDTEELGGLSEERLLALDHLGRAPSLLITGYGGLDPDVYAPLLDAASATTSIWASKSVDEDSPVRRACEERGIELLVGEPDGLADHALRELLGEHSLDWPEIDLHRPSWTRAFDAWAQDLMERHAPPRFAHAWAWLLADSGDRDGAASVMRRVMRTDGYDAAQVRLADILYDRAGPGDREESLKLYGKLAFSQAVDWPTRAHCVLRMGGIARGNAVRRGGWLTSFHWMPAIAAPIVVLAAQSRGSRREDPETTAAAWGVLGQTVLRASEQAALHIPVRLWPVLSASLRWAARWCLACRRLTTNGNRRALADSHHLLALALAALTSGRAPDAAWRKRLEELADSYRHAGDLPGAGNCTATLAVVEMADNQPDRAEALLVQAREFYVENRPNGQPIVSGAALLERLKRLFARCPQVRISPEGLGP